MFLSGGRFGGLAHELIDAPQEVGDAIGPSHRLDGTRCLIKVACARDEKRLLGLTAQHLAAGRPEERRLGHADDRDLPLQGLKEHAPKPGMRGTEVDIAIHDDGLDGMRCHARAEERKDAGQLALKEMPRAIFSGDRATQLLNGDGLRIGPCVEENSTRVGELTLVVNVDSNLRGHVGLREDELRMGRGLCREGM